MDAIPHHPTSSSALHGSRFAARYIAELRVRCQDYLRMGVPEVWIFDPESRIAYVLSGSNMTQHREGVLRLEGTPIEVGLAEVFGVLDVS